MLGNLDQVLIVRIIYLLRFDHTIPQLRTSGREEFRLWFPRRSLEKEEVNERSRLHDNCSIIVNSLGICTISRLHENIADSKFKLNSAESNSNSNKLIYDVNQLEGKPTVDVLINGKILNMEFDSGVYITGNIVVHSPKNANSNSIMYRKPLRLANKNDRKDMIMIPEVIIQIIG